MGVLDDAIREHIELRRKHGANASELERQEHEALGPARREAPAQPVEGEVSEDEVAGTQVAETELLEDTAIPDPAEPQEFRGPATPDVPEFAVPAPPPAVEEPPLEDEAPLEDQPPLEDEPPAPPEPPADPAEAEDVLEETPEFLQETPEHDRLWFEQKPPRDFDFDDEDR